MKVEQSDLLSKKEFELKREGLVCRESSLFSSEEAEIPYEFIEFGKKIKRTSLSVTVKIITFAAYIFFWAFLRNGVDWSDDGGVFWLLAGTVLVLFCWVANSFKKSEILIPTVEGYIIIWENYPDKETVSAFIQELQKSVKEKLILKYGGFDKDLPIDMQIIGYAKLHEIGAVSSEEYEELKDIALGRKQSSASIGFKS